MSAKLKKLEEAHQGPIRQKQAGRQKESMNGFLFIHGGDLGSYPHKSKARSLGERLVLRRTKTSKYDVNPTAFVSGHSRFFGGKDIHLEETHQEDLFRGNDHDALDWQWGTINIFGFA